MGVVARGASAHARGRERPPTQPKRLGGRNSNELLTQDGLRRAASHRYCGRLHPPTFLKRTSATTTILHMMFCCYCRCTNHDRYHYHFYGYFYGYYDYSSLTATTTSAKTLTPHDSLGRLRRTWLPRERERDDGDKYQSTMWFHFNT